MLSHKILYLRKVMTQISLQQQKRVSTSSVRDLCVLQVPVLVSSGDYYSYAHGLLRVTERNFSPSRTQVTYQGCDQCTEGARKLPRILCKQQSKHFQAELCTLFPLAFMLFCMRLLSILGGDCSREFQQLLNNVDRCWISYQLNVSQ